jgi:hypothetical protein
MNPNKLRIGFLIAVVLTVLINLISEAQVVVDNKNLNEDKGYSRPYPISVGLERTVKNAEGV